MNLFLNNLPKFYIKMMMNSQITITPIQQNSVLPLHPYTSHLPQLDLQDSIADNSYLNDQQNHEDFSGEKVHITSNQETEHSPEISESLALKMAASGGDDRLSQHVLDQSSIGISLNLLKIDQHQETPPILQNDKTPKIVITGDDKTPVAQAISDSKVTLTAVNKREPTAGQRRIGGTVIPLGKIHTSLNASQNGIKTMIKQPSGINQQQYAETCKLFQSSTYQCQIDDSQASDNIKLVDKTEKTDTSSSLKVLELGKSTFNIYPSFSNDEVFKSKSSDKSLRLSLIQILLKVATSSLIELELLAISQTQGDASPIQNKPIIYRLLMQTSNSQSVPPSAVVSRDGIRVNTIKVTLDGERLKGKWQTLCIDLDKILGTKCGKGTHFELLKLAINAPQSQIQEVSTSFVSLAKQNQQRFAVIKLSNQAQQSAIQRNNNSQQARSAIRPKRAQILEQQTPHIAGIEDSTQQPPKYKQSPQTTSQNNMGRTITGNSFTTTATSLNNTGLLSTQVIDQSQIHFVGKRRSMQQSLQSRQQERSRDITSASSQSLLKTPQSMNSSKTQQPGGGMPNLESLPPLFSSNKPRILTTQGGLNIIHERLPFSQQKYQPNNNSNNRRGGAALKSSSVAVQQNTGTQQLTQSVNKPTEDAMKGHRYLEKLNERQKRMEQKYFKKDRSTDPITAKSMANAPVGSVPTSSKKYTQSQHMVSIMNQRPSRMKMITTNSQGGGFTPFSSHHLQQQYGSTNSKDKTQLGGGSRVNMHGAANSASNFYDFKKSCATFSSTLRNFQEDYILERNIGGAGGGGISCIDNQENNNNQEVEESIQEEIDQSHRGQNEDHDRKPPLKSTKASSLKRPPMITNQKSFDFIKVPGQHFTGASTPFQHQISEQQQIQPPQFESLWNNNNQADLNPHMMMDTLDDADDDHNYSGLYLVECADNPGGLGVGSTPFEYQNPSNIDVLSNKTGLGFNKQRSFSPPFKV